MPALPPSSPRTELVRAAVHAASAVVGQAVTALVVTVVALGVEVEVRVTAEEVRAVLGPVPVEGLSVLATALHGKLTPEPMTAKRLAREAGYSMGSHVYAALRELEGRSLCRKTTKGYRLPP